MILNTCNSFRPDTRTPLVRVWRATGRPNAPLACCWVPAALTLDVRTPTEGGAR
jgi:hypothetical protein